MDCDHNWKLVTVPASATDRRRLMSPVSQWSGERASSTRPTDSHWEARAPVCCVTDRSAHRRVLRTGWSCGSATLLAAFARRPSGNMSELFSELKTEAEAARGVWEASQSRGTHTGTSWPDRSVVREGWSSEMRLTRWILSRPFTLIRFAQENNSQVGFAQRNKSVIY